MICENPASKSCVLPVCVFFACLLRVGEVQNHALDTLGEAQEVSWTALEASWDGPRVFFWFLYGSLEAEVRVSGSRSIGLWKPQ